MTLDNFVQSADVVIAFIIALAITAAFINLSLATRHKRKSAKAQAEYWQKKTAQIESTAANDRP